MLEGILRNISSLAQVVGAGQVTDMVAADSYLVHVIGIVLILALLGMRWFRKHRSADPIDRYLGQATKQCPNCTEQLPLSALMCETCDYNFLSGMIGHGHRLLPAPESEEQEMPKRNRA